MITIESLSINIPILSANDGVGKAKDFFSSSCRQSLPVVDESGLYIGTLFANDVSCQSKNADCCADIMKALSPVAADASPIDIVAALSTSFVDFVPLVDASGKLVACADGHKIVQMTAEGMAATEMGASVLVTLSATNYALTHLVDVVEHCGVRILSVLSFRHGTTVDILLKLATLDAIPVIDTLNRYGFECSVFINKNGRDSEDNVLKRNYDELMRYLNV